MYATGRDIKYKIKKHFTTKTGRLIRVIEATMQVGNHYWFNHTLVQLIQVTQKGFNFLNVKKAKCVFHRPFYLAKNSNAFQLSTDAQIQETICSETSSSKKA